MNNIEYKSPLTIAIIDVFDAYALADVFEDQSRYAIIGKNYCDLEHTIALADRLFLALNPDDRTLDQWVEGEAGHDVRIYDADYKCVYKAHDKLPKAAK